MAERVTAPMGRPRTQGTGGGLHKPEVKAEARRIWEEEGLSYYQVETRLGLSHRGHVRALAEREGWTRPDELANEDDMATKVWSCEERPPDPFKWFRDIGLKVLDKTEGGGWIPFRAWDFQKELMKARIARKSGIAVKSRQLGVTTCLQFADFYSLIWMGPFHDHWVAKDLEKSKEMLREIRESIVRCKLPEGIQERLDLGGKTSEVIRFETDRFSNYIHCHAPTEGVARGFPGNALLLDEAAFMPYAESIYTGFMGMMSDVEGGIWIVSTPNPEDSWFQNMYKQASDFGLTKWKFDWTCRPGRDAKWFERTLKKFGGRQDLFDQEHGCQFVQVQKLAFNVEAMKVRAASVTPVANLGPQPGHLYIIGGDQSMSGAALTVACVGDATVVPAQVVDLQPFSYDPQKEIASLGERSKSRTVQKAEFFDGLLAKWPGAGYIDGTNEQATVELMQSPMKKMVKFRGDVQPKEAEVDAMVVLYWPRAKLIENAVKMVDSGRLVVDPELFPTLYEAFKSALRYHIPESSTLRRPGQSQKRQGKRNDELDAFLLMCLGLTDLLGPTQNVGTGGSTGSIVTSQKRPSKRVGKYVPRKRY